MPKYSLLYKRDGLVTEFESWNDRDAFRVLLLAQNHVEPAELWRDGIYVTSLQRSSDGNIWKLYREEHTAVRPETRVATALSADPSDGSHNVSKMLGLARNTAHAS